MTGAHLEPCTDEELESLKKASRALKEWVEAGVIVLDPYDTYPDDIWHALTTPERLDRLLFRLQLAEQNSLSAKLRRLGRAVVDAMTCRF